MSGGRKAEDGFGEHWQQSYRPTDRFIVRPWLLLLLLVLLLLPEPVPVLIFGPGTYTKSERVDTGPAAEDSDTTWSAEQSVVSLERLHETSRRSRSHGSTYFRSWNSPKHQNWTVFVRKDKKSPKFNFSEGEKRNILCFTIQHLGEKKRNIIYTFRFLYAFRIINVPENYFVCIFNDYCYCLGNFDIWKYIAMYALSPII